jgi:endonuclease/exonuclease/phosphatase family metal-dependent hydrolase
MRRWLAPTSAVLLLVGLVACTGSSAGSTSAPEATIRIGELNIEYGGTVVDWHATVAAAEALDADVIAIEEAWGHIPRLAEAMDWPYYDVRRQIVSRLPLIHASGDPMEYLYVEVAPGQVVGLGNVHLASGAYGPNRTRTGDAEQEVLIGERRLRVPQITPYAEAIAKLGEAGTPSFLAGDFNSPSQLDWTDATVDTRPQIVYPVPWPVTELLAQLGFTDSYRQVHPDPVADPGLTWPSNRPPAKNGGWNPGKDAPEDRIDYVQSIGPATAVASQVIGEDAVSPWPSDHRGLVSTFRVTPAAPPDLVSADQALSYVGDRLTLRAWAAAGTVATLTVNRADGSVTKTADFTGNGGSVTFDTDRWLPGRYGVTLRDGSGRTMAGTVFWLAPAGGTPFLTVPASVDVGDPIPVTWNDAPGNRWDWVGIYHRAADPHVASYLLWSYTDASVEGRTVLDRHDVGRFPLPPGKYTAMLLVDDSYRPVASADFTIG